MSGVEHPVGLVHDLGHAASGLGFGLRINQEGAGAVAAQLNQERAIVVAVGRGALRVDGDGAVACGKCAGGGVDVLRGIPQNRGAGGGDRDKTHGYNDTSARRLPRFGASCLY